MYRIEIADGLSPLPVDAALFEDVMQQVLAEEGVASAHISLAFVDDRAIHELNRRYLNHDEPTDVLSFRLDDADADGVGRLRDHDSEAAAPSLEGEIVVSTETAIREAESFGWDAQSEALLYAVHGLLHLCGYDDLTEPERARMRAREREILQMRGLSPHYGDETAAVNRGIPREGPSCRVRS